MNLTENQKRWVVTGVTLNKVLLPDLRSFVEQQVQGEHTSLTASHNIHVQTAAGYLKKWPKPLKYENINGNEKHKLSGGKFDFSKFDFKVSNHVDLAKLYLLPYMVKFNAFDDHCDASAVLLLLGGVSVFSCAIQTAANDLRDQVRNTWAHANFTVWDEAKFQSSFKEMEVLVKTLCLPGCEETELLNKLHDWKTKGTIFCTSSLVDPELLKLVQQETTALKADLMNFSCESEAERMQLQQKLEQFDHQLQSQIKELKTRVDRVESDLKEMKEKMSHLGISKDQAAVSFENHFIGVPHRNANFTGRESELTALYHQFLGGKDLPVAAVSAGSQHQVLAISGLGGCGKTATAIEYSWRSRPLYSGGIFWLSGESDEMLSKSIDKLTELLGKAIGQQVKRNQIEEGSEKEEKDLSDLGQKLNRLLSWLHKRSLPWLVVVDNLDHVELTSSMFELLRGSWMTDTQGNILVTSRCKSEELQELLNLQPTNVITLHSLALPEATEFLKKRISVSLAEEEIPDVLSLADGLGGLPLALEQAAAYINVVQCTVKEYVEGYQDQKLNLLKEKKSLPSSEFYTPERLAIHTTWQVNIDHISKAGDDSRLGKAALLMIKICAFLCPDIIPVEVVNAGKPEVGDPDFRRFARKSIGQKQIINLMTKFSLFEKNQDLNSLSVHRLVQEVIIERCTQDHTRDFVLSCAINVLHKAFCDTFTASDLLCWQESFEKWLKKMTTTKPKTLPTSSTGSLWIKLATSSNYLTSHLVKCVSTNNARTLWFTKETARLFRETALYYSHFENYTESSKCHRAMLRILGGLKQNTSHDELDKLTRKVCLNSSPHTADFNCEFGTWSTSLNPTEEENDMILAVTEKAVSTAFAYGNYEQCCALIDLVSPPINDYNITNSGKTGSEIVYPDHAKLYNYRSASLLKLQRFEEALNDVRKWLKCSPDLFIAHERKVNLLCKLAESGWLRWRIRARAAMAVLLYMFGENKALKLKMKFPQILDEVKFVVVANTDEWLKLDEKGQKSDKFETIYLFTGDDYHIDKIVRTNCCISFVGLPGKLVKLHIKSGVLLSSAGGQESQTESTYMMEKLHVSGEYDFLCCGCIFQATECLFEKTESPRDSDDFRSIKKQLLEECLGASEERVKQLIADEVETLQLTGSLVTVFKMNHVFISNSQFFGLGHCNFIPNIGSGIALLRSSIILKDNIITNFSSGINILECGNSVDVQNNLILKCFTGIIGVGINSASFAGNKLIFNADGFVVGSCRNLQVSQNVIKRSDKHSLRISNSDGKVNDNNIFSNGLWGLVITSNSNLEIEHNNIVSNNCGGVRILMNGSGRVTLQNNILRNFGPPVCHVENPPLLEQQLLELDSEIEGFETFREFIEEFGVVCDDSMDFSCSPPKLVNNVTNADCREASTTPEAWSPDLCCNCCSSLDKNTYTCETCLLSRYCGKQCYLSHTEHRNICKSLLTSYTIELQTKAESRIKESSSKTFVLRLRSNYLNFPFKYELWDGSDAWYFLNLDPSRDQGRQNRQALCHFQRLFGQLEPSTMLATKDSFVYARFDDSSKICRVFLHEPAPAHLFGGPQ